MRAMPRTAHAKTASLQQVKATLLGLFSSLISMFLWCKIKAIINISIVSFLPLRNIGIQFMSPQDESEGKSVIVDVKCNQCMDKCLT